MASVNKVDELTALGIPPGLAAYMAARIVDREGCWEWSADSAHGYGVINFNKRRTLAHRAVGAAKAGRPLRRDELVCHHCDNRPCVNPSHLFVGSDLDNKIDASSKGRLARKLDAGAVEAIRVEYEAGGTGYRTLATKYGVNHAMIRNIVKRRSWRFV